VFFNLANNKFYVHCRKSHCDRDF